MRDFTREELEDHIFDQAEVIYKKLRRLVEEKKPDVLIPNNLLSVGYHVPAMVAFGRLIRDTGIKTIVHNHDFYFEESGEVAATCPVVQRVYEEYGPVDYENVTNLVINEIARKELYERKRIAARIVPNVFDFSMPPWERDGYNGDLRQKMGLEETDLLFLQATRVLDRKGIELAVDLIAGLNKAEFRGRLEGRRLYTGKRFTEQSKIVLVCAGLIESFGISGGYYKNLLEKAKDLGVDIRFAGEYIRHSRLRKDGEKIYSLWDAYTAADFVTYPSLWEGWGNQFIEAVFARLPVVLFEYPVYKTDLARAGFAVVSLGDKIKGRDARGLATVSDERIAGACENILPLLLDEKKRREMTDHNFDVAGKHFSLQRLKEIIKELL